MQIACAKTTEEFKRIFRFRYAIYIEEMGKPMPGADHERRELRDELDARATQLFIEREGEIAGTVRIAWGADGIPANYADWYGLKHFDGFPASAFSFTGRMMVAQKFRNSTLPLALAKENYRVIRGNGVSFDFIHTTKPLIPLFARMGHRCYNGDFVDPKLGPRTPMVFVGDDSNHLKKIKSPLISLIGSFNDRTEIADWFNERFGVSQTK